MAALFLVHCGICKVVAPDTGLAATWVGGEKLCPLFTLRGRNLFSSSSLFCILHINEMFLRGMGKIDTEQCRAPNFSLSIGVNPVLGGRAHLKVFSEEGQFWEFQEERILGGDRRYHAARRDRTEWKEKRRGWDGKGMGGMLALSQPKIWDPWLWFRYPSPLLSSPWVPSKWLFMHQLEKRTPVFLDQTETDTQGFPHS